jgi:ankyrin repeat protein
VTTVDNLRKSARRWLKAIRAGDAEALARLRRANPEAPPLPTLRSVQHALARERGRESWRALIRAAAAARADTDSPLTSLLTAAGRGDIPTTIAVLDAHPDLVNQRGALGDSGLRTALHFGVGHEAVVRALLERGADPNIRDEGDHAYPLHFAAERGHLTIVELLVQHGADPIGAGTTHELDVLGWAVCFEYAFHLEVARFLLTHGARHTLLSAVAMGDVDAVRALAASGADLNQRMDRTNRRRTPLHLAVLKKQPAAVAALIELGARLDLTDAVGLTALDQAALDAEPEIARLLIDGGAPMTGPAAIVLERHEDVERLAREHPEWLSTTDNRGWARLVVHAAERAPARVLDTLLRTMMRHRAGLSVVNMQDDEETAVDGTSGYTPLHAAAFHGNTDAVRVLLQHGANPRVRDSKYCGTPAGWAAYAGHAATAEVILQAEIDMFDAINFDRADRIADLLDRDAGALDRPFRAYASCPPRDGQWWPRPDCTPLEWATIQKKANALRVLTERGAGSRSAEDLARAQRVVNFVQSACWDHEVHGRGDHRMHDRAAGRLLAGDPAIARDGLHTAIICGDLAEVARIIGERPDAACVRGGARDWTPLLYLAYTRFTYGPTIDNAVPIARLLLDHGADPNDFYMAGDSRYTVLVGVAGEGEQDAPRQPYAAELFQLLLERGADPFDIQVLYNTHFRGDMQWWLDLVYEHTRHTARGAAWRDPDWPMFDMGGYGSGARFVLETAINTRNVALARWALERGANPDAAPARDRRFPKQSLYERARLDDLPEIADLLIQRGARRTEPALDDAQRFLKACLGLDRPAAEAMLRAHPEYLHSPAAMFDAARRNRPDVLGLLLELGFDVDMQDHSGKRALHEAAAHDADSAVRLLLDRGAAVDPRESTYGGTPIGWAAHGDKTAALDVLSRHSRDLWTLCFRGYVDRVRDIVSLDPALARARDSSGLTLLWYLPDDEAAALTIVDVLVNAGVDPAARSARGTTAADAARRRGMRAVAARLEGSESGQRPV